MATDAGDDAHEATDGRWPLLSRWSPQSPPSDNNCRHRCVAAALFESSICRLLSFWEETEKVNWLERMRIGEGWMRGCLWAPVDNALAETQPSIANVTDKQRYGSLFTSDFAFLLTQWKCLRRCSTLNYTSISYLHVTYILYVRIKM